ncbi:sulfonate transport system permease protein [Orenia metallireducens]|jgi:sulfonate transport system permease protein|uniref:Sulfonate transport system permease protein n=1 Tax=Orenia metallireducens TaxID=1413210 RepID=A0A285GGW4_9FIRM|nr:ABC transporter permease [Orenia metallireducens]PRX30463.1 sulfonate transport system permease protein [Orenia metallireducens]SNY22695.1 sulfonate transport system permease protein [Orenia metallireducens]
MEVEVMEANNEVIFRDRLREKVSQNRDGIYRILRFVSIVAFFIIWQLISSTNQSIELFNPILLPSPVMVIQTAYHMYLKGVLAKHLIVSLIRIIIGFGLGTVVAVFMGVILSHFQILEALIQPVLNLIGPIPAFAFLPLFIVWFGVGEFPKILLIAYATFFPILTYTVDGIKNINPVLIRSALSLGANQFQVFTKVIFKGALPNIFIGMKVSLALSFSALVIAEMMGADSGLGYIIVDARNWFRLSNMMLAAALIGIEYTVFFKLITLIERVLFKWKSDGLKDAVE